MTVAAKHFDVRDPDIDSESLPPGTPLLKGQYMIESYLSSGGFGITYLARDSLDRKVVIKECYPEALCSRKARTVSARSSSHAQEFQSLVAMFVREARNIAKLRHPNIVGVHQVFEDNQTAYMALDLIHGQDLLCIIEQRPEDLTPETVKRLLTTLLDAIVSVHDQDMLHRDISPDNILVDKWGNPILIDFGAAREQASKKSRAISALLVVKDGYSPQEFYISGGRQGPFSDLYSLAATFYHAITREAPPNSQLRLAAMAANRADPYEPLAGRIQGYDLPFLKAIDKAMNVFPNDRLQSARDWIAMIDPTQSQHATQAEADEAAEIQKIITNLVTETEKSIAEDLTTAPIFKARQSEPVEKTWEYLLPDENAVATPGPGDDALSPNLKRFWERINALDPSEAIRKHKQQRLRRKRLSALIILSGLALSIFLNPTANIATLAGPEIQSMIAKGMSFATMTTEILTASL